MNRVRLEDMELFAFENGLYDDAGLEAEERDLRYEHYRKCIAYVVQHRLTDRQRQYITMYYYEGKKMPEIARELMVNKSSVQRGIKLAKQKIRTLLLYNLPLF